ncbi:MAG: hypothetical protein IJ088_00720 [Clostridia bacterium]|nr:hypothetical protein [Clostridia bacterium]
MIRKICTLALCAVMVLPVLAMAENTVEILPTTPPMPRPVVEANPYAADDLTAYYEDYGDEYAMPALTVSERERLPEIQRRWESGERPESIILNRTEQVHVSLIQLPPEQYEGEPCFLLLPNRDLTDKELLQVVDSYGQLGLTLDPNTLSWHNCMRGGGIEVGIRSFRGDENERRSELTGLYTRVGLRPEMPFTDLVADDGVGRVTLDEEDFNGLNEFRFRPARRLTDEELLQLIALDQGDMPATPEELTGYETQLRQELHQVLGMPLSARRGTYEAVEPFDRGNAYGDSRMAYSSSFTEVGGTGRRWSGSIDISTGRLIEGRVDLDDRYYTDGLMVSDIRMDPWDEKWASIAVEAVTDLCGFEESGITEIRNWSETNLNELQGAEVRVVMADGGVYRVEISYTLEKVMTLRYNDAVSMTAEDDFYTHFMKEVPVNE